MTHRNASNDTKALTALVTGGAAGIGQAISSRLAHDGMTVLVADVNFAAASSTAGEIRSSGLMAEPIALDASDADSIAAVFADVEKRFGSCDVLVNSAGIAKTFPFLDFPIDNWNATMNVNVTGAMLCAQHAARVMKGKGWGRIVNIASISGVRASGGRTAYGTSKAALIGLTRQMAVELAPYGITANAVAPGPVDTPLARSHSQIMREQYVATIPISGSPSVRHSVDHTSPIVRIAYSHEAPVALQPVQCPADGHRVQSCVFGNLPVGQRALGVERHHRAPLGEGKVALGADRFYEGPRQKAGWDEKLEHWGIDEVDLGLNNCLTWHVRIITFVRISGSQHEPTLCGWPRARCAPAEPARATSRRLACAPAPSARPRRPRAKSCGR